MVKLALFVLLLLNTAISCVDAEAQDVVRRNVGVLAHRGNSAALERWQPTFDAVATSTNGMIFEVVPLSLHGVRAALSSGDIDYLLTNPGHLYRLVEQFRLSPIAALRTDTVGSSKTGNRFGAVIFVRSRNEELLTLADIINRKFAAVAPDAFGGFEIAAATLIRNGINPWLDFESIAFMGFPQFNVIEAVMSKKADAGTVRTGMLEAAVLSGKIEAHDIRILNPTQVPGFNLALSTELVPEWILSSTSRVTEPERRALALTLLSLEEDDPVIKSAGYGGWTTVPSDVTVRRLLHTVDSARLVSRTANKVTYWAMAALVITFGVSLFAYARRRQSLTGAYVEYEAATKTEAKAIHLTPREREILPLVGEGKTTKEIARELGISPKTVEFHRGHLLKKFDAHNMAELMLKAGDAPRE